MMGKKMLLAVIGLSAALFAAGVAHAGLVRYVSTDGTGDGSDWEHATPDLKAAYDAVADAGGGEVWIKAGTYTFAEAIRMRSAVAVRGGFAGGETSAAMADPDKNVTILNGDVKGDNKWTGGPADVKVWKDGVFQEPNPTAAQNYWCVKSSVVADDVTNAFVAVAEDVVTGAEFSGLVFTGFNRYVIEDPATSLGGDLTFSKCKFLAVNVGGQSSGTPASGSTEYTYGAAIHAYNVRLSLTDCEFVGITRPIFLKYDAPGELTNTLLRCDFRANRYHTIYYSGKAGEVLSIDQCTYARNYCADYSSGGCIFKGSFADGTPFFFRDCVAEGNILSNGGLSLIHYTGNGDPGLLVERCVFRKNVSRKAKASWSVTTGVLHGGGHTCIKDTAFIGNICTNDGTSTAAAATAAQVGKGTFDMINCTIEDNVSHTPVDKTGYNSSIFLTGGYSHPGIVNCSFINNRNEGGTGSAEVIVSKSAKSSATSSTAGFFNDVFANSSADYRPFGPYESGDNMMNFHIGWCALANFDEDELAVNFKNLKVKDGVSTADPGLTDSGKWQDGVYARGVAWNSAFAKAGRNVHLTSANKVYVYLPEISSSKPWVLASKQDTSSSAGAPTVDAFGVARKDNGKVAYGSLVPVPGLSVLVR